MSESSGSSMDATEVSEVLLAGRDGGSTLVTLALDDISKLPRSRIATSEIEIKKSCFIQCQQRLRMHEERDHKLGEDTEPCCFPTQGSHNGHLVCDRR
jgi:hypothetical protein